MHQSTQIIDARGMPDTMPTITLSHAMREAKVGEILELWSDNSLSQTNMEIWLKNTGQELVSSVVEDNVFKYRIKRVH
ncbi:MAG: sulfurtransferase TusA family protein [Chloroflexi bacterium]|nr:sulfurtransferase TusA family protein [Chloroflexota bacterium]